MLIVEVIALFCFNCFISINPLTFLVSVESYMAFRHGQTAFWASGGFWGLFGSPE